MTPMERRREAERVAYRDAREASQRALLAHGVEVPLHHPLIEDLFDVAMNMVVALDCADHHVVVLDDGMGDR